MRQTPVSSCLFGKAKDFLSRRHPFMSITNRFYFTAVQIKVKVIIAIVAICTVPATGSAEHVLRSPFLKKLH